MRSDLHFDSRNIPSTRFYGSKRKLLSFLHQVFSKIEFKNALDGFGGTASVSLLLSSMGKKVTYNDAFLFNVICARALFSLNKKPLVKSVIEQIEEVNPRQGYIYNTFSNIFFTNEENSWLDGCVRYINEIKNEENRNIFFYALIQACLKKRPYNLFHRANLDLRLNKVNRSFGNIATWNKSFEYHMIETLSELIKFDISHAFNATILNPQDVMDIKPEFDLVYFDPPYLKATNNFDDYNRKYHFLEGIVNYDKWKDGVAEGTRIKEYISNEFLRDWGDKRKHRDLLFSLIENHKHSIVVVSYYDCGIPSVQEFQRLFSQTFSKIKIRKAVSKYALSKKSRQEVVFIGLP